MSDVARWIADRRPRAPEALLARPGLRPEGDPDVPRGASRGEYRGDEGGPEKEGDREAAHERIRVLAQGAAEVLEAVLEGPVDARETALRLLEADALLTYACEAAADAVDPEASLRTVLDALGSPPRE